MDSPAMRADALEANASCFGQDPRERRGAGRPVDGPSAHRRRSARLVLELLGASGARTRVYL